MNLHQTTDPGLSWTDAYPGQIVPFSFEERDKMRHRDSHQLKIHQLIVKIDGLQQVAPVSVDRVGVYFRETKPEASSLTVVGDKPPVRVVFAVKLEGSARKLVTVRSALQVSNLLKESVEVKLENTTSQSVSAHSLFLLPHTNLFVPLPLVHANIWVRPVDRQVTMCDSPVRWQHVSRTGEVDGSVKSCSPLYGSKERYRFSVIVKRENFPAEGISEPGVRGSTSSSSLTRPTTPPRRLLVKPGHKILFISSLVVVNLLPYDLYYCVRDTDIKGCIKPGKNTDLHSVNISETVMIGFYLENFRRCTDLTIHPDTKEFLTQVEVCDCLSRLLALQVRVVPIHNCALRIHVSTPYWLVNKTGLPLVFKQDEAQQEAAGQFEEHELARSMSPLLFSFSDTEAPIMCSMRVGKSLHPNGYVHWCKRFHLNQGVQVRRLQISPRDNRPDWVYIVGIDVRMGRGRYRDTYIVTFSPRYLLENKSSHKLDFTQKFATNDTQFSKYTLSAMPKSSLPFHWPRLDLDSLLSVRLANIPDCYWSGGFRIDDIQSFHVHMRENQGKSHFLRVEVILQNATYFIVFTDTDKMPPPIRIDNHSEVPIVYYQTHIREERLKTIIRPHTTVPYAWDEPTFSPHITCCAPGDCSASYNMDSFGEGSKLYYENFIYVAFTGTFLRADGMNDSMLFSSSDLAGQELVLDVPFGTRVILSRKEQGKRSQLWRMTSTEMLQHEGSSPPRDPRRSTSVDNERVLVLDIAGLGPLPGDFVPLMLRKPDKRRRLTQTWRFTKDGRLCCGLSNLFVQAKDGFMGLKIGNEVVIGPTQPVTFKTMHNGVPLEQGLSRQKLRGGSGVLAVKVVADGPTRVLQITDIRQKQLVSLTSSTSDWVVLEEREKPKLSSQETPKAPESSNDTPGSTHDLQLIFHLSSGLGVSVINHLSEELVYLLLNNIMVEFVQNAGGQTLDCSIQNLQADNHLLNAEQPVMLYVTPQDKTDHLRHLPAVYVTIQRSSMPDINVQIFKHLLITIKNLTLNLEEILLLKLLQCFGFDQSDIELERMDENDSQAQRALAAAASAHAQRYYFSTLKLHMQQLRLSVLTSGQLPPELRQLKHKMGWRLIRFEDAVVELDPFLRVHPFETLQFLLDDIYEHYKEELKSQAIKILGAIDFLGNPLGLANDVSHGLVELVKEGNFGGLFKNVTHGLSNSAAKVTGSLSDGLGVVSMDKHHQEMRKRIRQDTASAGSDHLVAGLKGLGIGLLGGVTSILSQTYEGAATDGFQGFFAGLGKGLVGTVTKPTVGVLDFASGAASALRDTSRRSSHILPTRCRPSRLCVGPGGLLPVYSEHQAQGQEFLFQLNDRNFNEFFVAYEQLLAGSEDLRALISSEQVYILSRKTPSVNKIILTVPLGELYFCCTVKSTTGVLGQTKIYLQFNMNTDEILPLLNTTSKASKGPQVRCDSQEIADRVSQQVNYAKSLFEDRRNTVVIGDEKPEELDQV